MLQTDNLIQTKTAKSINNGKLPLLENGDRLTRDEFHRRYEAMPENIKAELIDGVVYISSPVRVNKHGKPHFQINGLLFNYHVATIGTEVADNVTY